MKGDPDLDTVKGCLSDDPAVRDASFTKLFEKYKNKVYSTAYRITGNACLAHDAAQETFVTVYQKVGSFNFRAKFSSWLYRIAVNYSIDTTRKASKEPPLVSEEVGAGSAAGLLGAMADPSSVDPERAATVKELESKVQEVVERISEPLRVVVVLRFMNGLSYKEIGKVLGCSLGTVKSRLNRAMRALEPLLLPITEEEN